VTADPGFVHLHVHSSYSLLEGALTIARLAELAKADRQPALALTDTDNMFGALEFSDKMASAGIQPIIGCALAVDFGDSDHGARPAGLAAVPRELPRIVLLAAREEGYRNLMRLNSRAFLGHAGNEAPHVKLAWLEGACDGLIALTGGPGGPLDRAIAAVVADPEVKKAWNVQGIVPQGSSAEALGERIARDVAKWRGVASGIKLKDD